MPDILASLYATDIVSNELPKCLLFQTTLVGDFRKRTLWVVQSSQQSFFNVIWLEQLVQSAAIFQEPTYPL